MFQKYNNFYCVNLSDLKKKDLTKGYLLDKQWAKKFKLILSKNKFRFMGKKVPFRGININNGL